MTQQTAIEVLTTVGYEGFVKALYNRSGDLSKDFTHAVLGIITESHEYLTATDEVNAIEEAGDLAFYLTALKQVLNDISPTDEVAFDTLTDAAFARMGAEDFQIMNTFVEWLDLAKRWVGYGKAPTMTTTELLAEAAALVGFVVEHGAAEHTPMEVILKTNVEKLLKRYNGMAFNAERAVNRDLPAERKVLETHAV
jgi:hypothetical protein